MKKTALFVEGATELIFVREYLLKWFEYTSVSLECFNLLGESTGGLTPEPYHYPNAEADFHFQIINAGGDNRVLSAMLKREQLLRNQGFDLVMGLRDMFSEAYKKAVKGAGISADISKKFIDGARQQINERSTTPQSMILHWAVMEIEAWMLGLYPVFARIDPLLTPSHIARVTQANPEKIDPEHAFFHPAPVLDAIFQSVGRRYDKSRAAANQFMGFTDKSDFEQLLKRGTCQSFSQFHSDCTSF